MVFSVFTLFFRESEIFSLCVGGFENVDGFEGIEGISLSL